MKKSVQIKGAPAPIGPYSQGIIMGSLMFVSGQICIDPKTGEMNNSTVEDETRQVMKNIGAVLSAGGLRFKHISKASIFLKNLEDFDVVNEVYASFLDAPYPARECVEVAKLPKDVNVEISVIASLEA